MLHYERKEWLHWNVLHRNLPIHTQKSLSKIMQIHCSEGEQLLLKIAKLRFHVLFSAPSFIFFNHCYTHSTF